MKKIIEQHFFLLLLLFLLTAPAATNAQQGTSVVSGIIRDAETNQGLPGVSILVKYSKRGTTTDADGKFSISAKLTDTLLISSTGYEPQQISAKYHPRKAHCGYAPITCRFKPGGNEKKNPPGTQS